MKCIGRFFLGLLMLFSSCQEHPDLNGRSWSINKELFLRAGESNEYRYTLGLLVVQNDSLWQYDFFPSWEGSTRVDGMPLVWLDPQTLCVGSDTLTVRVKGKRLILERPLYEQGKTLRTYYDELPRNQQGPQLTLLQDQLHRSSQTLSYRFRGNVKSPSYTIHHVFDDWVVWEQLDGAYGVGRWYFWAVDDELYVHCLSHQASLVGGYQMIRRTPDLVELLDLRRRDTLQLVPTRAVGEGDTSPLRGRWQLASTADLQALFDRAPTPLPSPSIGGQENKPEVERLQLELKETKRIVQYFADGHRLADTLPYEESAQGRFIGLHGSLLFPQSQDHFSIWAVEPIEDDWLLLEELPMPNTGKQERHRIYLRRDGPR